LFTTTHTSTVVARILREI